MPGPRINHREGKASLRAVDDGALTSSYQQRGQWSFDLVPETQLNSLAGWAGDVILDVSHMVQTVLQPLPVNGLGKYMNTCYLALYSTAVSTE